MKKGRGLGGVDTGDVRVLRSYQFPDSRTSTDELYVLGKLLTDLI